VSLHVCNRNLPWAWSKANDRIPLFDGEKQQKTPVQALLRPNATLQAVDSSNPATLLRSGIAGESNGRAAEFVGPQDCLAGSEAGVKGLRPGAGYLNPCLSQKLSDCTTSCFGGATPPAVDRESVRHAEIYERVPIDLNQFALSI
jgi:hypothetical protein